MNDAIALIETPLDTIEIIQIASIIATEDSIRYVIGQLGKA